MRDTLPDEGFQVRVEPDGIAILKKKLCSAFLELRTVPGIMPRVCTLADPEPPGDRITSWVTNDVARTATRKQAST